MFVLYKPKSKNQTGGMIMRSIGVNYLRHTAVYVEDLQISLDIRKQIFLHDRA